MPGSSPLRPLPPKSQVKRRARNNKSLHLWAIAVAVVLGIVVFAFPSLLSFQIQHENGEKFVKPFPVSVNPELKSITENPEAEALISGEGSSISAASIQAKGIFGQIASIISSIPGYELLGAVGVRFVTVYPGYRQEEVARAFAKTLGWSQEERAQFLAQTKKTAPALNEGTFAPGTYVVNDEKDFDAIERALNERFYDTVLARYSTSTEAVVPLNEALTIASLLERETSDPGEMRIISGIIWNRIWNDMNLQIDATLQYAKSTANKGKNDVWWPKIVPNDKYIKSTYNTYLNPGLPPAPIANPSVAAVIAALNPKKTECLFYFHDKHGEFHCSVTYKEHVALLKKYYGQGK